jgi:hypothetical protein
VSGAVALLWVLVGLGCVSTQSSLYKSKCLTVSGGQVTVDCAENVWSMEAMTISTGPPPCAQMGQVDVRVGGDTNGDEELQDDEVRQQLHDTTPGSSVVMAAVSNEAVPPGASNVIVEIVVTGADGEILYSNTQRGRLN